MVIIIGAGLSGLLTAYRLKKWGVPVKILEARNRVGGRIFTARGAEGTAAEMGATWFHSQHRHLIMLLKELELSGFEQYMEGKVFFQPHENAPIAAVHLPTQAPSYRIAGGTSKLIDTLYKSLEEDVLLGQVVNKIEDIGDFISVETHEHHQAKAVVLATPPKLWAHRIQFAPPLPSALIEVAKNTHTWMEDSIKVALLYEKPFWKMKQQAGAFFSQAGAITELYDHSNAENSKYALCGFVSPHYKNISLQERKQSVIAQLQEAFGQEATDLVEYKECVWAEEPYTFYPSEPPLYPHQNSGNALFQNSLFNGKLLLSSTEVSSHFGGYMEGAVYIAHQIADKVLRQI